MLWMLVLRIDPFGKVMSRYSIEKVPRMRIPTDDSLVGGALSMLT